MAEFKLDPNKLPKRLDIELPEAVAEELERRANESGRCISEIATEIIEKALGG